MMLASTRAEPRANVLENGMLCNSLNKVKAFVWFKYDVDTHKSIEIKIF